MKQQISGTEFLIPCHCNSVIKAVYPVVLCCFVPFHLYSSHFTGVFRGAHIDVRNKKGNTPLWLAANGGHYDVVQLLVQAGADVDAADNRKITPLMSAFRKVGHQLLCFQNSASCLVLSLNAWLLEESNTTWQNQYFDKILASKSS